MKKYYLKLKVKMILLLTAVVLIGCGFITYQQADRIREYYRSSMSDFDMLRCELISYNAWEDQDFIQQVYTTYYDAETFAGTGFYSMVKYIGDDRTIAEFDNFLVVERVEENSFAEDKRIILIPEDFDTSSEGGWMSLLNESYSTMEIIGTCDDTYIYLEELRWTDIARENSYSYIPKEKITAPAGAVKFEEWAGSRYYDEKEAVGHYYALTNYVCSKWGDTQSELAMFKEAKKICESIYEEIKSGTITTSDQSKNGLFTYIIANTGKLRNGYYMPYVYIAHPVSEALEEQAELFMIVGIMWLIMVFVISNLIDKVYRQQLAHETNRLNLTRGIAHELKTPLAITKGYVENWEYVEEKDRSEYAKTMIDEIDHMNGMVMDLLELSRLEAKRKKLNPESVDVYALTQSVLKRMSSLIEKKKLTVIDRTGDEHRQAGVCLINADLEMIRTVLVNFITNAVKYAEKEIGICVISSEKKVRFVIINDGRTIAHEKMDRVWDEFYIDGIPDGSTGSSGTGDRLGSSGLGLAIAKNILMLHKAKYGCASKDDRTEFWFEMKRAIEE